MASDPASQQAGGRGSSQATANRALGTIVPLLLLGYVAYAYHLVVIEYTWRYLHRDQNAFGLITALWSCWIHGLFMLTILQYAYVYLGSPGTKADDFQTRLARKIVGKAPPQHPQHPPPAVQEKRVIYECDEKGSPLRCWRDSCNGRWKPPRTRHCGTCQTCRPGLDHHCVWFNADVTAPGTIRAFLSTTTVGPLLLASALGPLCPLAWTQARILWEFARRDPTVHRLWWSHRWTWIGGPWTRYGWGFVIGAWLHPSGPPTVEGRHYNSALHQPSLRIVVVIFFGAIISLICAALAITTLLTLAKGDVSIDVARRRTALRALKRIERSSSNGDTAEQIPQTSSATVLPLGVNFFWVPLPHSPNAQDRGLGSKARGAVVHCLPEEQPYSNDDRGTNLRMMLGIYPFSGADFLTSWPIPKRWRTELERRAEVVLTASHGADAEPDHKK